MTMASTYESLEEQLFEAGTQLQYPSSSVHELLHLLDGVELGLARVNQSPTKPMQTALSPLLKALIADKLKWHSDIDVRVAVASCLSEITRITAPDPPYDDDQMEEVFKLIVYSLKDLYDESSRSYTKRISILANVARVRSWTVMLDVCDKSLIVKMFQHFFKEISEHHPENVFSFMETIMTFILKESDDITLDLISPILASVRENNEGIFPTARKLGERVLKSCASVLKPCLLKATKTLESYVDDYTKEDEIKSANVPQEELMLQVPCGIDMELVELLNRTTSFVKKEVVAKDQIVARMQKEIAAKNEAVAKLEKVIVDKDEIVAKLEKEVAARGEMMIKLEFEIEKLRECFEGAWFF